MANDILITDIKDAFNNKREALCTEAKPDQLKTEVPSVSGYGALHWGRAQTSMNLDLD